MNLTDSQIQQFTKAIVKHCILPAIPHMFECPSYEGMADACDCMPDVQAIYDAWLSDEDYNIDKQVLKIYSNIEDFIKKSLEAFYEL